MSNKEQLEQLKLMPKSKLRRVFDAVTLRKNFRFYMSLNKLVVAAQNGDTSGVEKVLNKNQKYLIQNPQAIDALWSWKNETGKTISSSALIKALTGKHVDTTELLLNRGASPILGGSWSGDNFTVVHFAVVNRDRDMVAMLLKRTDISSIIDARTKTIAEGTKGGSTALILAVAGENPVDTEIAELLLKAGASPYIKNNDNETALSGAQVAGHKDTAALLEQWIKKHPESEYQPVASAPKRSGPKAQS